MQQISAVWHDQLVIGSKWSCRIPVVDMHAASLTLGIESATIHVRRGGSDVPLRCSSDNTPSPTRILQVCDKPCIVRLSELACNVGPDTDPGTSQQHPAEHPCRLPIHVSLNRSRLDQMLFGSLTCHVGRWTVDIVACSG